MISHTKKFGVHHWDTFDNTTLLLFQDDSLELARRFVRDRYGARIGVHGADRVDIVDDKGNVVAKFYVG